nr:MAG TPA: hypothetical protein [Caudoviricetes sp.]
MCVFLIYCIKRRFESNLIQTFKELIILIKL